MAMSFLRVASERKYSQAGSKKQKEQLAVMVASICITLVTFCLTLSGAGSALAGARVVVARVSGAGSIGLNVLNSLRNTSNQGAARFAQVVPLQTNNDASASGSEQQHGTSCRLHICMLEERLCRLTASRKGVCSTIPFVLASEV
jgi:hypothetical protein